MNPQQKKQLEELANAALIQDYANKYLAYALSLSNGDVTTFDGPTNPPPPPKLLPPPNN